MRILCTADIHVGRCSALPEGIGGDFTAIGAWERLVDAAIQGEADAVVIAGDFYDSLPAQYESRSRVRKAFERLRVKAIPALAVTGNHDHSALRAFSESHKGLVDLFADDRWEAKNVKGVRFVGRSFGQDSNRESLLSNFDLPPANVTVGLVHADIDAPQSVYGPTPVGMFRGRGVAAWVVGHVHVPRRYENDTVVYPGSPQALDWGETGAHGFCWLEIDDGGTQFRDCSPLSTVRYEYADVDLLQGDRLEGKLEQLAGRCRQEHSGKLESVQFRVDVRLGNGADASALPEVGTVVALNGSDSYSIGGMSAVVGFDPVAEAQQPDARGQAARLLLGLEGLGEPAWQQAARQLVHRVEDEMSSERGRLQLPEIEDVELLRKQTPHEARRAVKRALEKVLAAA